MKLTFDPDFDSGAWPGPLSGRAAVGGEEWVGPEGMLGRLELGLGLGGPAMGAAERAASIVPRVLATEGFWSKSAEVDPLGSARQLLAWRDELAMGGWRGGEIAAPRLRQLAEVTKDAPPGRPDRLWAVAAALERRGAGIESLELFCSTVELEPAWRTVLARLSSRDTRVIELPLPAAAKRMESVDLGLAGEEGFAPAGDGSLQLLRPYGPLAAADMVAAYLSAAGKGALAGVVVVTPDVVLDAALRRHGLPSLGAADSARENLLLQILPLTLALAWSPPDPQRALELLTLPAGPVPRDVARRLADALHEWPAVGSDVWNESLERALAAIAAQPGEGSAARARRVRERLAVLFAAEIPHGTRYATAEARRRLDVLDGWLRGRKRSETDPAAEARWAAPLDQVASLRRLLDAAGLADLSAAQLQWLVEAATEAAAPPVPYRAQAGLAAVQAPGAIAGPASTVIWWNFTLEQAPPIHKLPLSAAERAALAAQGVALRDPGAEAMQRAARWRRPLQQARERLLLVTPRRAANGDEAFPHPLWDEIVAPVSHSALRATLEAETPRASTSHEPPRRQGVLRAVPAPRRLWHVPARSLPARQPESPSSLQAVLGCSLQWTLEHAARLRSGETGPLPAAEQLAGKLAHEILSRVLSGRPPEPDEARRLAETIFDEQGPRLAAPLFLPGADDPRNEARYAIALSAQALAQVLGDGGLVVVAAEHQVAAESGPWKGKLAGRPDLIVAPPPAVIDLKWGAWKRRQSLENGTALQLAAYAAMLREKPSAPWPDVAYFILRTQQLLTASDRFPKAEIVRGRLTTKGMWEAFEAAYREVRSAIDRGELFAPGNPDEAGDTLPDADDLDLEGRMVLAPPCHFCELEALCGRVFGNGGGSV